MSEFKEITWVVWTDPKGIVSQREVRTETEKAYALDRGPMSTEHGYCIATIVVAQVPLAPAVQTIKAESPT
jgi:hypothetical protein